jgi:hypothetical protein
VIMFLRTCKSGAMAGCGLRFNKSEALARYNELMIRQGKDELVSERRISLARYPGLLGAAFFILTGYVPLPLRWA